MEKSEFVFKSKKLDGILEIEPEKYTDHRGSLIRIYDKKSFANFSSYGITWVQESLVYTKKANTLRGLHVSLPPQRERKIITAIRGTMKWIALDLRKKKDTFGHWDITVLSAEKHNSLFVDVGFAHGCVSLTDDCEILIKADQFFSDVHSTGIIWNDPDLKIDWGISTPPIISEEHENYQSFKNFLKPHGGEL